MAIDNETMQIIERCVARALSDATSLKDAAGEIAKGVTQYVGARYVPLFAEPLDWDSKREYEPLTIVLYQGASYTSRQYVPVGIEITNANFWAITGNYNAQVEQYRRETQAVSEKYDSVVKTSNDALTLAQENSAKLAGTTDSALKTLITNETERAQNAESSIDSKVVAETERATASERTLTESIANETERATTAENANTTAIQNETERARSEEQKNAAAIAAETTRATTRENELDAKISKSGFNIITIGDSYSQADSELNTWPYWLHQLDASIKVNNFGVSGAGFNVGSKLFHDQLQNANEQLEDHDSINYIVIAGGRNDIMDESAAMTRITELCTDARTWFPNARVIIVPMLWDQTSITENELAKINAISKAGNRNGADVIIGAWIWGKGEPDYYQTNDIHPNAKGAKVMAGYILSALKGTYSPRYERGNYSWRDASFEVTLHDNLVTICISGDMTPGYANTNYPPVFSPQKSVNAIGYTNSGTAYGIYFFEPESSRKGCVASVFGKSSSTNLGGVGCSITYPA